MASALLLQLLLAWCASITAATGNLLLEFTESTTGLQQIAFSPDGKRLASASDDGAIIWDATTGKQLLTFTGHGKGVPHQWDCL